MPVFMFGFPALRSRLQVARGIVGRPAHRRLSVRGVRSCPDRYLAGRCGISMGGHSAVTGRRRSLSGSDRTAGAVSFVMAGLAPGVRYGVFKAGCAGLLTHPSFRRPSGGSRRCDAGGRYGDAFRPGSSPAPAHPLFAETRTLMLPSDYRRPLTGYGSASRMIRHRSRRAAPGAGVNDVRAACRTGASSQQVSGGESWHGKRYAISSSSAEVAQRSRLPLLRVRRVPRKS